MGLRELEVFHESPYHDHRVRDAGGPHIALAPLGEGRVKQGVGLKDSVHEGYVCLPSRPVLFFGSLHYPVKRTERAVLEQTRKVVHSGNML